MQLPPKGVKKLGIMGGTFDPIHFGHLVTAEEARQQYGLEYVVFVPSGNPPHKKGVSVSNQEHRYLMTFLAVINNPFFAVSRVEIERSQSGPTYTIDTVRWFRDYYGPETRLFFITGADAILDILTWKDHEQLLDICQFIAASRPGYAFPERMGAKNKIKGALDKIDYLEIPAMAISSTEIRRRVALGKTIKYLTPEAVEYYIIKNKLWLLRE
ncbi:MAG TPA: nicotinate-nucleotide adenylyltransferase [Firmicutes bacterium]|nr:nicotinate-nucleotide adenylyltransferase [Bacillota bacterium]